METPSPKVILTNPKDVLVELFTHTEYKDSKIRLNFENEDFIRKTPYNYAKVIMVPDSKLIDNYNQDTNTLIKYQVGDIVSFDDSLLEGTPITDKGYTSEGKPRGGYLPLGKILHYMFIPNKLEPEYNFLFLIPQGIIKYKHYDIVSDNDLKELLQDQLEELRGLTELNQQTDVDLF